MTIEDYDEDQNDNSLNRRNNSDAESEIEKWIGALENHLDKKLPMEALNEIIETPEEFFDRNFPDYMSNISIDTEYCPYEFIKMYFDEIEEAIEDLEQDAYGVGDVEKREILKKKKFKNSSSGNHELNLLKLFNESVEDFLYDLRDEIEDYEDYDEDNYDWNDDEI